MKHLLVIAFLFVLLISLNVQGQQEEPIKALFVHKDTVRSIADANLWRDVLLEYQVECCLSTKAELDSDRLSGMDVIIVGPRTADRPKDEGVRWFNYWGDQNSVDAMVKAEVPIIGLSMGGLSLFGQMDMPIGGGHFAHGREQLFTFSESAGKYLKFPFGIENTPQVKLSTREQPMDGYYHPPSYIESILQSVNSPSYYPVVRYKNYVVWGAGTDAGYLTEQGRHLFANITYDLVNANSRTDKPQVNLGCLLSVRERDSIR